MINRFKWLEVKPETRKNIAIYLSDIDGFAPLKPTGHVEVAGNKVVCDGFTDQDLCSITPELLRAALGANTLVELGVSTTDIYEMFYELVRRLEIVPVEIKSKDEEIPHKVTEEEIKNNNLEKILLPGDEIKIPVKKANKK